MNGCVAADGFDPAAAGETINRWIRGETLKAQRAVTSALDACAFGEAAAAAYRFVWNIYCDWYLELAKPVLGGEDAPAKAETRAMAAWALDVILRLLHPMIPFITEELWERTGPGRDLLISAAWPDLPDRYLDEAADAEIGWLVALVSEIRQLRAEMSV